MTAVQVLNHHPAKARAVTHRLVQRLAHGQQELGAHMVHVLSHVAAVLKPVHAL